MCYIYIYIYQIPPLRVKREWYREDIARVKEMAEQEQVTLQQSSKRKTTPPRKPSNFTPPFSEFESRFGRHADPLYSRHQTTPPPAPGVDPKDENYIYVDPHVLATPTIADTDGDGTYAELVVGVSYYFDPYRYGNAEQLERLGGLEEEELLDYTAVGVVIIDLDTGAIKAQRMLGIARGIDSQPGYLLATPTVVRLSEGEDPVIIQASAMGEIHVVDARTLNKREGFPVMVDSVTAQVGVADLFGHGRLELVVGDASGNVYCIDGAGKRVWERELDNPVVSTLRLGDVEGDGLMEVFVVTRGGDVWVLNGQTGRDHTPTYYPIHLNSGVESALLPIHLKKKQANSSSLALVIPTSTAVYITDTSTGCVYTLDTADTVAYEVVSGDVDPFSPGLELLALGLDGTVLCFSIPAITSGKGPVEQQEAWSMEPMGESLFIHKNTSFYFVLPLANTSQEIAGTTFDLALIVHSSQFRREREFSLIVSIGRRHMLFQDTISVKQRVTDLTFSVPAPPTPVHAFMTVRLCNVHAQCRTRSLHLKFNLHSDRHLKWFLCFPFLCVCCLLVWVHRELSTLSLPTTSSSTHSRKDL